MLNHEPTPPALAPALPLARKVAPSPMTLLETTSTYVRGCIVFFLVAFAAVTNTEPKQIKVSPPFAPGGMVNKAAAVDVKGSTHPGTPDR